MIRRPTALALTACALFLAAPAASPAAFTFGTQGLADFGSPTINSSSLATATVFYIADLVTTRAATGDFANPPAPFQDLGSATFDTNNIGAFKFGNATFGYFYGVTMAMSQVDQPSVRSYQITGTFAPGTNYGSPGSSSATVTISFTQTSGAGMAISDSATLSVPAITTAVPEPASVALLGVGLVGLVGVARRRHRAA